MTTTPNTDALLLNALRQKLETIRGALVDSQMCSFHEPRAKMVDGVVDMLTQLIDDTRTAAPSVTSEELEKLVKHALERSRWGRASKIFEGKGAVTTGDIATTDAEAVT